MLATYARQNTPLHTRILDNRFRSLKVASPDNFFALPILRLNSDQQLIFSFDEIGDDFSLLEYRLVHCNADWTQSSLIDSEFIPAFNNAKVTDYAFSSNTYIHYVNYRITIPNEEITPLVSGNYILQVVPEEDPDNVLLQARFCVSEEIAGISPKVSAVTDRGANDSYQQVEFSLSSPNLQIRDPFSELIVVIEQNNDPYSSHILTHPSRIAGKDIIYDHLPQLIFNAGNEFRRFETVRADYPGMNVDSVSYISPAWQAFLVTDNPRIDNQYSFDSTQNGRFLVREYNATDSDLAADYITTHFSLDMYMMQDADVYVQGEFSNWELSPQYKMHYDINDRKYKLALPLKQGAYNYRYVSLPKGYSSPPPDNMIEGDRHETRNEYSIKVYYRTPGARADRLIATSQFFYQ